MSSSTGVLPLLGAFRLQRTAYFSGMHVNLGQARARPRAAHGANRSLEMRKWPVYYGAKPDSVCTRLSIHTAC